MSPTIMKAASPSKKPSYTEMVKSAIIANDSRKGVSRHQILKHIVAEYNLDGSARTKAALNLCLKRNIEKNILKTPPHHSGSFRVNKEAEKAVKKVAKKSVAKMSVAKKSVAKKSVAKKSVAKKSVVKKSVVKKSVAKKSVKKADDSGKKVTKADSAKMVSKKVGVKKASKKVTTASGSKASKKVTGTNKKATTPTKTSKKTYKKN